MVMEMTVPNRDSKFDNIRALVIFLMVLGHFISIKRHFDLLYSAIYIFHMPLMVFVSGYFSKDHINYKTIKSIYNLIIAYVLMVLISALTQGKLRFFLPSFAAWYLLSLIQWKLLLPVILKLRYPIFLSFTISLLCGFSEADAFLSFHRTLAFLPFFVTGYFTAQNARILRLKRFNCVTTNMLLGSIYLGALIATVTMDYKISIFWMKAPYQSLGLSPLKGMLGRVLIYCGSFAIILLLINIMPSARLHLTKVGENSVVVYVLHIIVYYYLSASPYIRTHSRVAELLLLIVLAGMTCWVCSCTLIQRAYDRIVNGARYLICREESGGSLLS